MCNPIMFVTAVLCPMVFGLPSWGEETLIFTEDFESGTLDKWDADSVVNDPSRLRLTEDPDYVFRGKYAVEVTAPEGAGTGAKLNKWFLPGYDQVYARWYCRFAEDFDQGNHMHFVHLLANRADNRWSAFGSTGHGPRSRPCCRASMPANPGCTR